MKRKTKKGGGGLAACLSTEVGNDFVFWQLLDLPTPKGTIKGHARLLESLLLLCCVPWDMHELAIVMYIVSAFPETFAPF
jgi:hypothetical protein